MAAEPRHRPLLHAALSEPLLVLGGAALLIMMGATVADVVGRNVLALAVPGVVEIVETAMLWCTFTGIAAAFVAGGHITVDLVDTLAPVKAARAIGIFARAVTVAGMAGLTILAFRELLDAIDWGDTTVDLGIPHPVFWVAIVGGYGMGAVAALAALALPAPKR